MRRLRMILAGVFVGGVLLAGIGVGIAFLEFSSLTYAGAQEIGTENIVTENFEYTIDMTAGLVELDDAHWRDSIPYQIKKQDSLLPGQIRYQITYNEKQWQLSLRLYPYESEEPEDMQGCLTLIRSYVGDDVENFMKAKDLILQDLKNNQIGNYCVADIKEMNVYMSTETAAHMVDPYNEPITFDK